MSEATTNPPAKKLHNPLHVTIAVAVVAALCSFRLFSSGTPPKYVFGLLLAVTLGMLALEKINKAILVLLGAGLALILGFAHGEISQKLIESVSHGEDSAHSIPAYIVMIDWGTIGIIIGSTIFVTLISRSGLFTWISVKILKVSQGDPFRLLICFSGLTVVFSAFLNNVTAMIIVGSLTIVACKKLKLSAMPFLLAEGIYTNIGGLLTLISSIPNIIVGNAAGITFVTFFAKAAPYVVVVTGITIWLGARVFGIRPLDGDAARSEAAQLVSGFDENDGIESRFKFNFGVVMLGAFIATIAAASIPDTVLPSLGMGYVALSFAVIMLVQYKSIADRFYQAVDWDLLAFFGALFVVINVMEHAQVLALIGRGLAPILELGETVGPATMLFSSAVASSVTDNIPLAAMLAQILGNLDLAADSPYWWAVIFGANLGGNITPIGSASTLVAVTIIHKHGLELSFAGFVRAALPFAALQLVLAAGYVLWVL